MENITNTEIKASKTFRERPYYAGVLFLAAIVLPVIAFGVEIVSHWCAEVFFDPIPTFWHVLLVASVPLVNFKTWWDLRGGNRKHLNLLGFANAAVIFAALFYTIVYAPLMPIAVIGLMFFGLGILPLTPVLSLVATLLLRRELLKETRAAETEKFFGLRWAGMGAAFALILGILAIAELPFTITKIGMKMAASENVDEQNRGLSLLKNYGSDDYLLRNCYSSSGVIATDFVGETIVDLVFSGRLLLDSSHMKAINIETAREIFYRLRGKDFRQVAAPQGVKEWERERSTGDFDDEGNRVVKNLTMTESRLDGSVDGDAAIGYLEWTMVFKNTEPFGQREAIANIQLPPDAVVSRLTLWINGEEREAAFAGRERVTAAYDAVTATRRDPVLVTTAGKDRIAVKAFPVQPNGGEMKVRIGMTIPLVLENQNQSALLLPHFNERNFAVSAEHLVWIESRKELGGINPKFTIETNNNLSAVRGKLTTPELASVGAMIRAKKSPETNTAWTKVARPCCTPEDCASQTLEKQYCTDEFVKQEIVESVEAKPSNLILVVDTSEKMRDFQKEIVGAIKNLPNDLPVSLILTGGNGLNLQTAAPHDFAEFPAKVGEKVGEAEFGGGADAVAALNRAFDLVNEKPNSAIIWIHAPQPQTLSSAESLKQNLQRRPTSAAIYSLPAINGANVVEKELDGLGKIRTIPRYGKFSDDLTIFFSELNHTQKKFVRKFEKTEVLPTGANLKETSPHLARLWASEEVTRLLQNNRDKDALELSVKNQLVTPVSGAVVLETQAQYDRFGLKPVDPKSVPTIPEPEEYLLFAIVLMILSWFGWRYKFPRKISKTPS